ncbi:MAG TPA: hypothetical protein VK658_11420 [Chryseolinea sp.]|nr:hypothetical protein [Chryseolinea sp.]
METPNELTASQSLDLISRMIREAKGRVQQNSFYFLLWGWVILMANLGVFILTKMAYPYPYIVWAITVPAWIISIVWGFRQRRNAQTTTHFGRISTALWFSLGVVIFTIVAFGGQINFQVNPIILLISAIPTFTSGIILKFRPLILGGILFWVSGVASFLVPRELQPLIGAVAIACCYLVPGYMLKNRRD